MKRVALALVFLLVAGSAALTTLSGPDLTCPGVMTTAFRDASYGVRTPRDALGTDLDTAARVTEEADDSKGFETVTFRGYDEDGDLLGRVVVEGGDRGWVAARVDTCG